MCCSIAAYPLKWNPFIIIQIMDFDGGLKKPLRQSVRLDCVFRAIAWMALLI